MSACLHHHWCGRVIPNLMCAYFLFLSYITSMHANEFPFCFACLENSRGDIRAKQKARGLPCVIKNWCTYLVKVYRHVRWPRVLSCVLGGIPTPLCAPPLPSSLHSIFVAFRLVRLLPWYKSCKHDYVVLRHSLLLEKLWEVCGGI